MLRCLLLRALRSRRGCRLFLSKCLQSISLLRDEGRGIIRLFRCLQASPLSHGLSELPSYSCFFSALTPFPLPGFRFILILKLVKLPAAQERCQYSFVQVYIAPIGKMPKELRIAFFQGRIPLLCGSKIKQLQVRPKKYQTLHYSNKKMDP